MEEIKKLQIYIHIYIYIYIYTYIVRLINLCLKVVKIIFELQYNIINSVI